MTVGILFSRNGADFLSFGYFTDGCESHITGVGTALLSIYFRFLFLNNMPDGNSTMTKTST